MYLPLYKYINKTLLCVSGAIILAAFLLLNCASYDSSSYSSYQHPFLTLLIMGFYMLLIAKLNFTGSMFVARFKSLASCMIRTSGVLCLFATAYYSAIFVVFLSWMALMGGPMTVVSMLLCYLYSLLTLWTVSVFYVVLSFKVSNLFARIILYSLMFLSFAMNFSGEIFVRYNFFFFNMYSRLDQSILSSSMATYAGLIFIATILLQKKEKEL